MNLANMFVVVFLTYFSIYFVKLISKKRRTGIQSVNQKLNELRKVPIKSQKQQKEFLDLKYPKSDKFKWSWKGVPHILLNIFIFVIMFRAWLFLFGWVGIDLKLWQAILFIVVAPLVINLLLERFNLQKSDIRVFLR